MLDYHVILDLVPTLANLFFSKKLGANMSLAATQRAILLCLGLQRKSFDEIEVSQSSFRGGLH